MVVLKQHGEESAWDLKIYIIVPIPKYIRVHINKTDR